MRLFIYEFAVAQGGLLPGGLDNPIIQEGQAMLTALLTDVAKIKGCQTTVMTAGDLPLPTCANVVAVGDLQQHDRAFQRLCQECDTTIIVAPEFENHLFGLTLLAEQAGAKLASCSSKSIELTADKFALSRYLREAGINCPRNWRIGDAPRDLAFPLIAKPRFGAGSWRVQLVHSTDELTSLPDDTLLEEYHPGFACSVSVLCDEDRHFILPPCEQRFEVGGYTYAGGVTPIKRRYAERAVSLASNVIRNLPPLRGYIGIDLSLGESPDGKVDYVIEVNPRLTTSYIGLRKLCRNNLLGAWLDTADGQTVALSFEAGPVEFSPYRRV